MSSLVPDSGIPAGIAGTGTQTIAPSPRLFFLTERPSNTEKSRPGRAL